MSKLEPKDTSSFPHLQLLFDAAKRNMGFIPNSIKIMGRNPGITSSFATLTANIIGKAGVISPFQGIKMAFNNMKWTLQNLKRKDSVPLYLKNLVAHVSSNASGCRYCQAHTIKEANNNGASIEKIEAVWEFETSPLFDEAERAALRFGFAAGCVPNAVTDEHFVELRKHFTENQIVELGATVALFGFLNRWNDTFGTPLEAKSIEFAEKHLAKSGWEVGKHNEYLLTQLDKK